MVNLELRHPKACTVEKFYFKIKYEHNKDIDGANEMWGKANHTLMELGYTLNDTVGVCQ